MIRLFQRHALISPTLLCGIGAALLSSTFAAEPDAPAPSATSYTRDADTLARGKALFLQQCASCHALASDAIGPPLGGVTTTLSREALLGWIREPAKVIAAGDPRAVALLRRYKVQMPSFAHLPVDDLLGLLAYVDQESATQHLKPFPVDLTATADQPRLIPPIQKSNLIVELEDVVQIPRLPKRTPYKGITLLRPDPRADSALIVDDLMGILYRVKGHSIDVFLDVREIFPDFICDPGVATGLGSFALHPDFVSNGLFYTTHAETFRGRPAVNATDIPSDVPKYETPPLEWVLTEWHLDEPSATTFKGTHREVLRFVTPTTGHGSQEIAFAPVSDRKDPDYGKLYIGIGDGGSANLKRPDMAGHPRTFLASILRIDPRGHDSTNGQYGIPADNPFAQSGDPTIRKEIWAYGFRNPHRFSWDTAHGRRMIGVDIGESNVEEVNLIEKGGAYGWGLGSIEGTTRINIKADAKIVYAATPAELAPFHLPIGEYDHRDGSAITGGFVYQGPLEALRNKYVFGDIVNGRLFFMNMDAGLSDHTVYELNLARDGAATSIKTLSHVERAHLRLGYDDRTGDLFIMTKEDGMIRRVSKAYTK